MISTIYSNKSKYSPRWGVYVNGQIYRRHRYLKNAQTTARVRRADMFNPNDKVEIMDMKTKQIHSID